jgi:3-hydroxyisobutyrate dehydrogenase-like beta-hydroxyacid dehydrogenase
MDKLIGIVHPGVMGIFVAASMVNSGYEVYWASEGRSPATATRAEEFGLVDVGDLASLCHKSDVLVSVCPPHAALEIAEQVVSYSFSGIYLDANAISPQKTLKIADLMQGAGIGFVDGGIIGGPDWEKSSARLYLSGENAEELQRFFVGGLLQTASLGVDVGRASALKMCYAAYTKGMSALLASIFSLAENHHVRNELASRWEEDWPGFYAASQERIRKAAVKAWRFEGEMKEISETFSEADLPDGFHQAASEIYARLGGYKNISQAPDFEHILKKILNGR